MPVNPLFEWCQLNQSIDIDRLGLLDFPLDRDGPRTCLERARVLCWLVFIRTELIVIVVVGYVLRGRWCVCRAVSALDERELGIRIRRRGKQELERTESSKRRAAQSNSLQKLSSIKVGALGCDRRIWKVDPVNFFDQHDIGELGLGR